jgi:spore coat polysaccharide biosynthesis protein SpsF
MPFASPITTLEIIADAGPEFGYGHIGRCLALAEELGDTATFAVAGDAARFVNERGGRVGSCPETPVVLLDRRAPTDVREVRALAAAGRRVVLLDDLGSGRDEADLVIDPPTAAHWPSTPAPTLAGFEHVLLRREVRRARRSDKPGGVLVAMGGSDPEGATVPLTAALHAGGVEVTANLGPGYVASLPPSVSLVPSPQHFIEALAVAQLLIASYGHTLLEAAYLGVPAIAVVLRPEHREHAEAFCYNGTAAMLDMSNNLSPGALVAMTQKLLASDDYLSALTHRGRELIDGRGTERVAAAIQELV